MKDEIKIKTIGQLLDYVETEQKAKELINYITNLQQKNEKPENDKRGMLVQLYKANDEKDKYKEENERLYKELEKADSITQSCIFEGSRSAGKSYRQCLNWLEDYKSRIDKAVDFTNRTIEIIKQQPSGNDEWILERLNGINYCLGSDE